MFRPRDPRSGAAAAAAAAAALVVLAACVPPPGLTTTPTDDGLLRRVARIASKVPGRFGVAALHVESGRRLEWNAGEEFEAASVVKLALLVDGAARIAEGTLDPAARWTLTGPGKAAPSSLLGEFDDGLQPTERDLLRLMISRSDNTASNRFIDLFGAEAVNRRMASLGFPGIRLVGRIPDASPEETLSARWKGLRLGVMTPRATAELYRRIATRTLFPAARADGPDPHEIVWDVLSAQRQLDRIPRLAGEETGSRWAGKTGTMRGVRLDSGVLTTKKGRFVLVVFVDGLPDAETIAANRAMGEIAKEIVDAWSRELPDVLP